MVADPAGDHADLVGADKKRSELGTDVEHTMLQDDEEVAVCAVEGRVHVHGLPRREDEDTETGLHGGVSGAGDKVEGMHPVNRLVEIEGIPAELIGDLVEFVVFRVGAVSRRFSGVEG